jgi:hypothetical protein
MLRVASYRFRATFAHRWGGYLALVLLIGLLGGLAMGAVAAARRTQSSFHAFIASTNPSDITLGTALYNPASPDGAGYDASLVHTIAHLPHVKHVESYASFNGALLGPNGAPSSVFVNSNANVNTEGSVDGEYFNQDRLTVTQGRLADPTRADEVVMPAALARQLRLHVGQVVPWGFYTNTQEGFATLGAGSQPYLRLNARLVGLVVPNDAVVQDAIDANYGTPNVVFTPALTRRLLQCCTVYSFSSLQLEHGSRDVAAVESELERVTPPSLPHDFNAVSLTEAKAQRAIKPQGIALGVFGGIAALAAMLIAAQAIGRQIRLGAGEESTLRALGADPIMTIGDSLIGIVGAIVVGSLVAGAVAVAVSPLAPIGPVRPVYPSSGIAVDWTVLGLGLAALIVGLSAIAAALAYRAAPHRAARGDEPVMRGSALARAAASSGLPTPAVTGIRFALEPGAARNAVPVRSAILGAALAMIVVIGTLTFGASLDTLVSHPALYGWNWSYELGGGGGVGTIPQQQAASLLDRDRSVAAWANVSFATLQVDGQSVPVLGESPHATVAPPVLSGHGFDAPDEVVLGATTLADLHKRVGDSVEVRYGPTKPTRLKVVGTATMPATGIPGAALHPTMGFGALLSYQLIPDSVRNSFRNSPDGPNAIFVRLRGDANPSASLRTLNQTATALTVPTNYGVSVVPVQRPAEIVNYRSMGTTPAILGAALGAGAITALGLTLIASVRRRRRDLALLKALGFTKRQLAATVAWQASVAVGIGIVVGVPLGIVLGRFLWDLFAHQIHVVAAPSVPTVSVILVAAGALALANVVAAIPGRIAARTPTAVLLHAE